MIAFPSIVPLLADKADITLKGDARAHPAFRIYTDARWAPSRTVEATPDTRSYSSFSSSADAVQHLLSHLYAQRSTPLWKPAPLASWFAAAVAAALPKLPRTPSTSDPTFARLFGPGAPPELAASAYRHVMTLELRPLLAFVPRAVGAGGSGFGGDPLPPRTRVSAYDDAFFAGGDGDGDDEQTRAPRSRREEGRMLERMVPDRAAREQLQVRRVGPCAEGRC